MNDGTCWRVCVCARSLLMCACGTLKIKRERKKER